MKALDGVLVLSGFLQELYLLLFDVILFGLQ